MAECVADSLCGEAELFAALDCDEGEDRTVRCTVFELSVDASGAYEAARPGGEGAGICGGLCCRGF